MTATWNTLYEGTLDNRAVTLRESDEGSYQLLTRQIVHDEGIAYQDGATYVHVSPASAGEAVESEVTDRDSLPEALRELHFSAEAASELLGAIDSH